MDRSWWNEAELIDNQRIHLDMSRSEYVKLYHNKVTGKDLIKADLEKKADKAVKRSVMFGSVPVIELNETDFYIAEVEKVIQRRNFNDGYAYFSGVKVITKVEE